MRIIDNFFKDPYTIRKLALSRQFLYNIDDNSWPGIRSEIEEPYRSIYSNQYKKFFDESVELLYMYFQSIDKSYCEGTVHFDDCKYTVITYLNLDIPSNSGTEVYDVCGYSSRKECVLDLQKFNQRTKVDFNRSNRTLVEQFFYKKKLKKFNFKFKDPCVVSNRFNRTLIFNGERFHRAQNFFGTTLSNSRLTLVSFYK